MRIDGLVERPKSALDIAEITAFPRQRQVMTMQCIGNWIGGPLVGNAEWGGTPFLNLLDEEVLLAWEMNGEQLPSTRLPRLITPGHYGQKMPKWITHIELIDEVYLGYWESKPEGRDFKWSDDAIATVNSRIDAPISVWDDIKDPGNGGVTYSLQRLQGTVGQEYAIHGIAMAGERIVDLVEISTAGGATWSEAHILSRPEANVWVSWAVAWQLPTSGRYEILVRATDSAGVTQPRTDAGVDLYDGRTGWHSVPVNVATA